MSLPRAGIKTEQVAAGGMGTPGETAVLTYNTGELWDGTSRLVICLPGHGTPGNNTGPVQQYNQNTMCGIVAAALARTGRYVVCALQADGATSWSNPRVDAAILAALPIMRARGVRPGKYGGNGYSMGGLGMANHLKRHSADVAAVMTWAAAINLYYVYSEASSPIKAGNANWTSEVDAAYGSWGATAGYRVSDEPQTYRGLGVPWKLVHATDDNVIPYSVSRDFVTNVNDPNVTLRQPDILGSHTGLFLNVPDAEIVAHFDSGNWG